MCYWHQVGESRCAAKEPAMLRDSTAVRPFNSNGSKAMVEIPNNGEMSIDFVAKMRRVRGLQWTSNGQIVSRAELPTDSTSLLIPMVNDISMRQTIPVVLSSPACGSLLGKL